MKSLLFLWDGLKIPLIANGEEHHWKERKNRWFVLCIFPYQLLLILLIYLLILFPAVRRSLSREIVVVSLKWSFKNLSDRQWRKISLEKRKNRWFLLYIFPLLIAYSTYLLTYLLYLFYSMIINSWNRRCFFKMAL